MEDESESVSDVSSSEEEIELSDGSKVEELDWGARELSNGAACIFLWPLSFGEMIRGVFEEAEDEEVEEEEEELEYLRLRLQKASAAKRPAAVEMSTFMVNGSV